MSKAVNNDEISLDDIFAGNNASSQDTPAPEATQSVETPTPKQEPKREVNSNDTSSATLNSKEDHELTEDLGPVDPSFVKLDKNDASEIKSFQMAFHREGKQKVYDDAIVAIVDVKESFAEDPNDFSEVNVRLKNNNHDNKVIKHVFGPYGVDTFDKLKQLTNPDTFAKAIEKWHQANYEFKFPIYRTSSNMPSVDDNGNPTTTLRTYYKFTNRPGGSGNQYSAYYDEHNGFPSTPDAFLNHEIDMNTNTILGKVLSTNMNRRFKRFEVEFLPVKAVKDAEGKTTYKPLSEIGSPEFKKHLQDEGIYSYVSFYKYADRDDDSKVDTKRRSSQAGKVSAGLGVSDYKYWDQAVGEIREFKIRQFNSARATGGQVYRAYLK